MTCEGIDSEKLTFNCINSNLNWKVNVYLSQSQMKCFVIFWNPLACDIGCVSKEVNVCFTFPNVYLIIFNSEPECKVSSYYYRAKNIFGHPVK